MRGCWAWGLWHQGYPDRAREVAEDVLRHARRPYAHPYHSRGLSLILVGIIAIAGRWEAEAEEIGNEAVAVGNEHGLPTVSGTGLILQGWVLSRRGANGTAVERIRNGIAAARFRSYEPIFLGLLAEALALTGKVEEGLAAIGEALAIAEASEARGNEAELHRLRGELLRRQHNPNWTEVEDSCLSAVAIARQQGTRGFELRAAVSLARLLTSLEAQKYIFPNGAAR
jgi:predicted ATPase